LRRSTATSNPKARSTACSIDDRTAAGAPEPAVKTTLPLWMYVRTFVWPSVSNNARRSCIGTLRPVPTLTPRRSAMSVGNALRPRQALLLVEHVFHDRTNEVVGL